MLSKSKTLGYNVCVDFADSFLSTIFSVLSRKRVLSLKIDTKEKYLQEITFMK